MNSSENNNQVDSRSQSGVGPLLRAARERVGSELTEISLTLRIRRPYLEAIEEDRYEDLPGATYTVGFIRSYAEHLGLDADEVVRRYKNQHISSRDKQRLIFPVPISENRIPGFFTILVGAVVVFFAYSLWHVSTVDNSFLPDSITVIPEHFSELMGASKKIDKRKSGSGIEKTKSAHKNLKSPVKSKSSDLKILESKELSIEEPKKIVGDKQIQKEEVRLNQKNKKDSNSNNSGFSDVSSAQEPDQVKEKNIEETGVAPLTAQTSSIEEEIDVRRPKKLSKLGNANSESERVPTEVKSVSEAADNNDLVERVVSKLPSNQEFQIKFNQPDFSGASDLSFEGSNLSRNLEAEMKADRELNSNRVAKVISEESPQLKVEEKLRLEGASAFAPKIKEVPVAVFKAPTASEGGNTAISRDPQDMRSQMPVESKFSSLKKEGALIENKNKNSSEKEVKLGKSKKDEGIISGGASPEKTKLSKSLNTEENSDSAMLSAPTKKQDLIDSLPDSTTEQSNRSGNKISKAQQKTNNEVVSLVDQDSENSGVEENVSERVEIVATGNSWIQIRDDLNNKMLMTRLMKIGDRYKVPDQEGLQLLTGNAGALDIFVNGEKAPSIGGDGVVRRRVILEGARLRAGTAVDD